MQKIEDGQECISASDIVSRFRIKTGVALHPTNAGAAAAALGTGYIEVDVERPVGQSWYKPEKRYPVSRLPEIFSKLQELADRRAHFGR